MCGELGCYNVVMLFPERSQQYLTYLALLLKNLAQLHCAQKHGLVPSEWTLGILFNVHKLPLGKHGTKQNQVGFNLVHGTQILHHSAWGSIEEVAVLTTSKVGQLALGRHGHKSIATSSYYAVAKISGGNKNVVDLMKAAVKAWATQQTLALNNVSRHNTSNFIQIH